MTTPLWITPAGFLGTVTEKVTTTTSVTASGQGISYSIISGRLPGGLRLSNTGTISGTPYSVANVIKNEFVVRAQNNQGLADRTFVLDVQGPSSPSWLTPPGFLPVGSGNQFYGINKQFIDYQLSAEAEVLPQNQKLRYFIEDNDGQLPPGLELLETGRIVGQINDILKLNYKKSGTGGYDKETYDNFPYDHGSTLESLTTSITKFIPKTYQFNVTVTDGVAFSKRAFKIKVEDASSLRVDNSYILIDTNQYLADAGYLLSPQWLTPANLGVIRANNRQVIKLDVYDFNPFLGPTTYDWDTPTVNQDGSIPVHPPNFVLDSKTGALYAKLPYQPQYSITYKFTVLVKKTALQTGEETATARTFTLTIRGDVESEISWVSGNNIGSLFPGQQSELSVVAEHKDTSYAIQYKLLDGRLPTGLSLLKNGNIAGQIEYDTQTYFDRQQYGYNSFKLDGGTTTFDKSYNFTVQASDIYNQNVIVKDFVMSVVENDITKYTQIYAKPLLSKQQRRYYLDFIANTYTFDKRLLYRADDPAFGLQEDINLTIEHGIQQVNLIDYSEQLRKYFYRKRFYFGEVKYSKAEDPNRNYVYDIVYVEIVDNLKNQNGSIKGSVSFSDTIAYPNSVENWRTELELVKLNGDIIKTDEFLMPRFMRTIQPDTGSPLGFILAMPICFALPGKGDTIVKRIAVSGFNFNVIDFEIDRLHVKNNLTEAGTKYLLFPRKDIIGTNLGEDISILFTEEGAMFETEDGRPIYAEL